MNIFEFCLEGVLIFSREAFGYFHFFSPVPASYINEIGGGGNSIGLDESARRAFM